MRSRTALPLYMSTGGIPGIQYGKHTRELNPHLPPRRVGALPIELVCIVVEDSNPISAPKWRRTPDYAKQR